MRSAAPNITNQVIAAGTRAYGGAYASRYTAYEATQDDFTSGKVTWLLNNGTHDGTQAWYQDLAQKNYPSFAGKTVYAAKNNTYTNDPPQTLILPSDDGFSVLYVTKRCVLVFASYKNGKLTDAVMREIDRDTNVSIAESGLMSNQSDTIKAMLFEDMRTLVPICDTSVITAPAA